ncbi:hypothetical protein [Kaarinaea lacus]
MLDRFSIYVEAQWADGSHFTRIMFDDFILIPEDHYLYFNLEDEIGPKNRIEIFQNSKGRVHGYVAEHQQGDVINENIDYHRKIVASISEIEHKNWGVPWERESSLIGIVDRDDGYSSWTEAVIKVYIGAQKRTESIAHAYYNSNG